MAATNRDINLAASHLARITADAYSFSRYGFIAWRACCSMLLSRGYNAIEVECIMRSVMTRFAADGALRRPRHTDLARLMDEQCGGAAQLRTHIDEIVHDTFMDEPEPMMPPPVKSCSRHVLRLAWSR